MIKFSFIALLLCITGPAFAEEESFSFYFHKDTVFPRVVASTTTTRSIPTKDFFKDDIGYKKAGTPMKESRLTVLADATDYYLAEVTPTNELDKLLVNELIRQNFVKLLTIQTEKNGEIFQRRFREPPQWKNGAWVVAP